MKRIRKFFRTKAGYTMMELLMVNIIIGILASTALPQYVNLIEKARTAEGTSLIGMIRRAESLYKLENGNYTADLSQLGITVSTSGDDTFWTYGVAVTDTGLTITATRTARKASGHTGETVSCTYNDVSGDAVWSGTYTAVIPK